MNIQRIAFNIELPQSSSGDIPEWVELIPAGPRIQGRDGRWWLNDQPDAIVATFISLQRDVPVDLEHATEIKAPAGEPAPAYGWIKELEVRDGQIWGRVEWTDDGRDLLLSRKYRYLSPAFVFDEATRRIERLSSVGLTNKHNLHLPALNHETEGDTSMPLSEAIRKALGLNAEATEADAVTSINNLQSEKTVALNAAQNPPLDKFVPRADYDQQKQTALNAQTELAQIKKDQQEDAVTTAVDAAIEARKITPANRDYYLACCREDGGLARFNEFVGKQPALAKDSNLDGKKPEGENTALNQEQQQIAELFGNSADDLQKYGQA